MSNSKSWTLWQRDDVLGNFSRRSGDKQLMTLTPSDNQSSHEVETWFNEYFVPIRLYLSRRLGPGASEDAAAEVFLRAMKTQPRYQALLERDDISPLAWLYGIATNVVADSRRIERRRLALLERLAVCEPSWVGADSDRYRLDPSLVTALRGLSEGERDAILLVAWGELSYQEAAVALNVEVGTIKSRIARARERLKRSIAEQQRPQTTQASTVNSNRKVSDAN